MYPKGALRRRRSKELKALVLAACAQPGVSVAAVAQVSFPQPLATWLARDGADARVYNNALHAKVHLTQTMKDDRAFALGYFRPEDPWTGRQNAGHMVVDVKTGGQLATVDCQQTPPAVGPFPPRDMAMDSRLHAIVPNTSPPGTPR